MTTFLQWRSPGCPLERARSERPLKSYDIRIVDQFYAYCQAVARTEQHRATVGQSRLTPQRTLWAIMVAGAFLGYYLLERLNSFASLF